MKKTIWSLIFTGVLQASYLLAQQKYDATWESLDSRPIPQWFADAKFGIFIHWGLYSVLVWRPLPSDGAGIYDCYAECWAKLTDRNNKVNPLFTKFHREHYGENFAYPDFVKWFTCDMFRPDDWATLFREAGARYVILTSKHHEGFALWPSAHSWNWNAMDAGPHRDLAGELSNAVKKQDGRRIQKGSSYSMRLFTAF